MKTRSKTSMAAGVLGLMLGAASPAAATWPSDPAANLAVCTAPGSQEALVAAPDRTGGTIIAWRDSRGANPQMYVQRLAADGTALWTTNGVALGTCNGSTAAPAIVGDGAGGAIVVWFDWRDVDGGMYAQRVGNNGIPLWAAGGVRVGKADYTLPACTVVTDNAGGAVFAWQDYRGVGSVCIVAQRVPYTGLVMWHADGEPVGPSLGEMGFPVMASDGGDGAFIVWREDVDGDPLSANSDIFAMHVIGNGLVIWGWGLSVPVCSAAGEQSSPVIVEDGSAGAIVAWRDDRDGNSDLYAQRLLSYGEVQWTNNGVPVSAAAGDQIDPVITTDGAGGAIVAWRDRRSGTFDIYAQRLYGSGEAVFAADGQALCLAAGQQISPVVAADGSGGAVVAWTDLRTPTSDIYARHIDAAGAVAGPVDGVALCTASGNQDQPVIAADTDGGTVVVWRDIRSYVYDIYAQRLSAIGALGSEPIIAHVQDVPNDQGGLMKLSWYASSLDASPTYGVGSYWIWRSVPPNYARAALARGATLVAADKLTGPSDRGLITTTVEAGSIIFWEYVGSQYAGGDAGYSYVVPTTSDSLPGSNPRTLVRVQARSAVGGGFWSSPPDSGYSVDNLAPAIPGQFSGNSVGQAIALHWLPGTATDLAGYELYRGDDAGFVPGPATFVTAQADTGYVDHVGGSHTYKLCAADIHGNRSGYAVLVPQFTSGVESRLPAVAVLSQNTPNPFNPRTTIRFDLPAAGPVRLSIYDVSGRLVRKLVDATVSGGNHAAVWNGCDDNGRGLGSGCYVARLAFDGKLTSVRMTLVR